MRRWLPASAQRRHVVGRSKAPEVDWNASRGKGGRGRELQPGPKNRKPLSRLSSSETELEAKLWSDRSLWE